MGTLPKEILAIQKPAFTHTAVDYFGPVEVANVRGQPVKRCGALFTCLTTRTVYLNVAKSLSAEDFMLVFRRFEAIHSRPKTLHSDNGTNFVKGEKILLNEIKELYGNNHNKFAEYLKSLSRSVRENIAYSAVQVTKSQLI